jgi:predicted dienelactone hydrolase
MMLRRMLPVLVLGVFAAGSALAQQNRVDVVTSMAPELAVNGRYPIGVRTLELTARDRPDVVNTQQGAPVVRYDRKLTVEVWYPARLAAGQQPGGEYHAITRDGSTIATLHGQAVRDAAPASGAGGFPLVIVSHGFPGNRYLMTHLGEHLASAGFVVVALDHRDSTYEYTTPRATAVSSALYNRSLDVLFVLDEMARLSQVAPAEGQGFLGGLVDATHVGVVGYSFGGYGVVNVVGGGYSAKAVASAGAPPNGLLAERGAANPAYRQGIDPRIKAAIAIAPWGMQLGVWDADGLAGIRTPVLFVAGSKDDIVGYEDGTKAIYQGAVNADRYLLTFVNAHHNAAAPIPAPAETYFYSDKLKFSPFEHYADGVWDTVRMNNILDHFASAYFGLHLKGEQDKQAYFAPGWKGFKERTTEGLILEHAAPRDTAPVDAVRP